MYYPDDADVRLRINLYNSGHERIKSHAYRWNGMRRGSQSFQVWQYTVKGLGAVRIGDTLHMLPPGYAFFVDIPSEHEYFLPRESDSWEILFLTLGAPDSKTLGDAFREKFGAVLKMPHHAQSLALAWEIFGDQVEGIRPNKFIASALAYRFMMTLFSDFEGVHSFGGAQSLAWTVTQAILTTPDTPPDVTDIAKKLGMTRSHFTRIFTRETGIPPGTFMTNMRLKIAIRLLQTAALPIKEIALQAGFSDVSYFCRVFRKEFQMTPEQFRSGFKR